VKLVFLFMSQQVGRNAPYPFDYRRSGPPGRLPFSAAMWPTSLLKALAREGFDTTLVFIETLDFVQGYFAVERVARFDLAPGVRAVYCADAATVREVMAETEAIVIRHDYRAYRQVFAGFDVGNRPVVVIMAGRQAALDPEFLPECRSATVLVNSEEEARRLRARGLSSDVFLKPAAELFYEPLPEPVDKVFDGLCIVWDTTQPYKRIELLLDALPLLNDLAPRPITVAFAGRSDGHAERLVALGGALGRITIERLGRVGREESRRIYHQSRVTIVPSGIDANPQVIAESLACGVPVACASDLTGGLFQITRHTGRTFAPTPAALARTVADMLAHPGEFDPARHCVTPEHASRQIADIVTRRAPAGGAPRRRVAWLRSWWSG
jgi:hypothetical protein